jgi:hypothetical protein
MRRLAALFGLVVVFAVGATLGTAPAAPVSGQSTTCQRSSTTTTTTSTTTTTTTTTTPTSTSTTTTPTTTTTPAPTIPQPQGHPLNNNTVENCSDGTIKSRSKLQVGRASGKQADPVNFAYAYAHDCSTGCQAVAAAFQVALIPEGTSTQAPQNVALAINYNCQHCGVFAYAYQYAVDVPAGTRLSRATLRQIAAIRREAAADVNANLTFVALDGKLRALAGELRTDVDNGLQKQHLTEKHKRSSQHLNEVGHHYAP